MKVARSIDVDFTFRGLVAAHFKTDYTYYKTVSKLRGDCLH